MQAGVYEAKKKNGAVYFRSNITYKGRHISLGSYTTEAEAHAAYACACRLLSGDLSVDDALFGVTELPFDKVVPLINFRDNGMYVPTPIYLRKHYFSYYLTAGCELKFDIDDLFYYSSHRILRRQGHLYVNHYGLQVTLLSRYGIKSHAVAGRDFRFANGDSNDFRYSNIEVINPYFGVSRTEKDGVVRYRVRIHIRGSFTVGAYADPISAAIAYNKAADLAKQSGIDKNFPENYIEELSGKAYAEQYRRVQLSEKYLSYLKTFH